MAMARKYTTLRKKLRELEAKVVELLTLPPETPHHDLLSDGVEQRLASLKALVSAEMAAHAPPSSSKPTHLLHITEKLTELEVAFREWDHCLSAASISGVDNECSCGESGMNDVSDDDNDDVEGDADDDDKDINMEELGFKVYDVPKELREDGEGRLDEKTRRLVRRRPPPCNGGGVDGGKYYYRVWATGAVLGAFSMAVFMARFSACFYVVEYLGPLTPT